jgi:Carboxypeptidase regulatory-like domain
MTADQVPAGSIHGTVMDANGGTVEGARVTLQSNSASALESLLTNDSGFFNFTHLPGGTFRVSIISKGFADWVGPEVVLPPGSSYELPKIVLQVAPVHTDVEVVLSLHELATEQVQAQEKQRVLGVFPNFYVSYVWHAAPLTPQQKFKLALRSVVDPVTFMTDAAVAGIEQSQGSFSGYGSGGEGYAKRFGATYTDDFVATMIGGAILPSVFHQDPRYFYKGTGSIGSRALYAISTTVICRGDNGHWQPNYSNVLGALASAGISNLYYPASNRNGAGLTVENAFVGVAEGAVITVFQEFLIRKISRGVQSGSGTQP